MPPIDADEPQSSDPVLERIEHALRAAPPAPMESPPDHVWTAIAAATGFAEQDPPGLVLVATPGSTLRTRSRRRGVRLAAIAAAVIVVAGVSAISFAARPDGGDLVAAGSLAPLASGEQAAGRVAVRRGGGELRLDLKLSRLPEAPTGSYYELWIIDRDVKKLISLGPLRADGRYVLPGGVDMGAYPVVDVSVEPIDGNTSHSGASLLRGVLEV